MKITDQVLDKLIENKVRLALKRCQLIDTFEAHFFLEFYYRYEKRFLTEHFNHGDKKNLFEQYGVFNGLDDILRIIWNKYQDCGGKDFSVVVNKSFVHRINVKVSDNQMSASYVIDDDKAIHNNKIDVNLIIPNGLDCGRFNSTLAHELQHAYEDYNLKLKGGSLSNSIKKIGYEKNNLEDLFVPKKKDNSKNNRNHLFFDKI